MEEVFLFTKNSNIYEGLNNLARESKKFKIIYQDILKEFNIRDIYIVDDNILGSQDSLDCLEKINGQYIILQKKTNMAHTKNSEIKVFYKPLKIFELYNEIINRIESRILESVNWKLDKKNLELISKRKEVIKFTEKEVGLLSILMQYPKKNFSKESLLKNVWGIGLNKNVKIETRTVETSISRIRKKLMLYENAPKIIKERTGYKILY